MRVLLVAALVAAPCAWAQTPRVSQDQVEKVVAATFAGAAPEWRSRLKQDETQRICSTTRGNPSKAQAAAIQAREAKSIFFPADGDMMGDWKRGAAIAESGLGGQFSDPPSTVSGGNCYACHQMDPTEISFGTLGPSLAEYGRFHDFSADAARAVYAKIFDPEATLACSNMPRFGHNGILTEQQIKDLTAYLMARDSPVNAP